MDRRSFLKRSGLTAGGLAALGSIGVSGVRKAEAGFTAPNVPVELKKNICTHCSVGCSVVAEVQNGVWVGQEPAWDSPINRGSHCAKGARCANCPRRPPAEIPDETGQRQWQKISWDGSTRRDR
jgi:formate dehydrogenase major subunit